MYICLRRLCVNVMLRSTFVQVFHQKIDRKVLQKCLLKTVLFFEKKPKYLGWLGLYSDMSKVGNVNLPGREIDKYDEISG